MVRDTTKPVITLNGTAEITLESGIDTYTELGASVADACDPGVTLMIGGAAVNPAVPGTYIVTYNATDTSGNIADQVTRTVTVRDTTKPVITLNGAAIVTLECGIDTYTELGAAVTDASDLDLSIIIGGDTVNAAVSGTYVVTYNAVLAFENEGHSPGGGQPHSINVERGLNFLFNYARKTTIGPQTYGYPGRSDDPDSNGNGQGVYFNYNSLIYETGLVMQAIVASNTPGRVVTTGPCVGMSYRQVMEDIVDFLAWGQVDGGLGRGGWWYSPYYNAAGYADNSVSQWPVLGLVAAELGHSRAAVRSQRAQGMGDRHPEHRRRLQLPGPK